MIAEASSAVAQPDPAKSPATVAHPPRQDRRAGTSCGHGPPMRTPTDPVCDAPAVADLLTRAGNGDKQAWDALVVRYAPLIWSICRRYRLGDTDTEDVGQSVWLRLVDHLHRIREPAALPGWLATVTRRECLRVLRARAPMASYVLDAETVPDERAGTAEQELLAAERHAALREAFGDLPLRGQRLILLLTQDPPVPYAEISARLGIAVGSIGPNRLRYIDQLRRHPAITALINTGSDAP